MLTAALCVRGDSVEANQLELQEDHSYTRSGAGYCSCSLLYCEKLHKHLLTWLLKSELQTLTWSAAHLLRYHSVSSPLAVCLKTVIC